MTDRDNVQSDEPMVADPEKAGTTEQTGGSGTGTPGSSNISGQKESRSSRHDSQASETERSPQ
jgi:hypothetical protein